MGSRLIIVPSKQDSLSKSLPSLCGSLPAFKLKLIRQILLTHFISFSPSLFYLIFLDHYVSMYKCDWRTFFYQMQYVGVNLLKPPRERSVWSLHRIRILGLPPNLVFYFLSTKSYNKIFLILMQLQRQKMSKVFIKVFVF